MKASFKKLAARTGAVAALASSMAFALPAFAFAAEKKTSGIAAILPTMDEFIPMLVAFLILLAILAKWGWPMFDKVLVKRENTIRAALEQAEENRIESDRVLKNTRTVSSTPAKRHRRSSPRQSSRLRPSAPRLPRVRRTRRIASSPRHARPSRPSSRSLAASCRPRLLTLRSQRWQRSSRRTSPTPIIAGSLSAALKR